MIGPLDQLQYKYLSFLVSYNIILIQMSLLFTKKDVTDEEYIIKYALTYLGMKKIKDESVDKIIKSDENK